MSDLVARWEGLVGERSEGEALLARYREPHRRYHTTEHLREVLAAMDELREVAADAIAVELAVWFHDAIYDPRAAHGENERSSAVLAARVLESVGVERAVQVAVARLVQLTAWHEVEPGNHDGAVLSDADLSILGAPPERYERYVDDVRAEYAHVDDEAWRAGRGALLRGFLERERLFVTERAHAAWDQAARRNLSWELASLGA